MDLAYWDLSEAQASIVLQHPAWTRQLAEHPDAIARRIDLLRRAGRHAEAERERQRLDTLRRTALQAAGDDQLRVH